MNITFDKFDKHETHRVCSPLCHGWNSKRGNCGFHPAGARTDAAFQSRLRVMDIDETLTGRRQKWWICQWWIYVFEHPW